MYKVIRTKCSKLIVLEQNGSLISNPEKVSHDFAEHFANAVAIAKENQFGQNRCLTAENINTKSNQLHVI